MKEACAVVLAAGKGTRMKSDLPKVLCPVVGRPMIHFVLDALEKAGIHRHIVVVGHEAEMVEAEVKTRAGQTDFVLQSPQLGTGHAVQICRDVLAEQQGPTIVVAGDSPLIQPSSLVELLEHFEQTQPALLLGTLEKRIQPVWAELSAIRQVNSRESSSTRMRRRSNWPSVK